MGDAQKSFAHCLEGFTFETVGGTQTDDEYTICNSLKSFAELILQVEEERNRMVRFLLFWTGSFGSLKHYLLQLENASSSVLKPLEEFRKKYIGGVKNEKKKFEKQTAKFCQNQERYLNKTTKNPNSLQEVREIQFAPALTTSCNNESKVSPLKESCLKTRGVRLYQIR